MFIREMFTIVIIVTWILYEKFVDVFIYTASNDNLRIENKFVIICC